MPDADVALCIGMHGGVASVPEEPYVLLVCDGFGVEEVMIDFGIWAEVEEGSGDRMETSWDWVLHGDGNCVSSKNRSVHYLYMLSILLMWLEGNYILGSGGIVLIICPRTTH